MRKKLPGVRCAKFPIFLGGFLSHVYKWTTVTSDFLNQFLLYFFLSIKMKPVISCCWFRLLRPVKGKQKGTATRMHGRGSGTSAHTGQTRM